MTAPVSMQGPMTYAQEMARKVFDATEEARGLAADVGWPKVEAVVAEVIERCAQEAETAYGLPAMNGDGAAEAARRIRALATAPAPRPAAVPPAIGPGKRSSFPADYGNEILADLAAPQLSVPAERPRAPGPGVAGGVAKWDQGVIDCSIRKRGGTCSVHGAPAPGVPPEPAKGES